MPAGTEWMWLGSPARRRPYLPILLQWWWWGASLIWPPTNRGSRKGSHNLVLERGREEGLPPFFGPTPSSHRFPRRRHPPPLPKGPSKPGRQEEPCTSAWDTARDKLKLRTWTKAVESYCLFSTLSQEGLNLVPLHVNIFRTLANLPHPPF